MSRREKGEGELTAMTMRYRLARTLESYLRQVMDESRLETSSYPRALQGEPVRCFAYFARDQIVAGQLPLEGHFGAT